jgi:threonine/homoserine/homoserine lactone efflux protein
MGHAAASAAAHPADEGKYAPVSSRLLTGHLASFLALSAILIVVPGPDMALVARNALVGGRRAGMATSAGAVAGLCVWTLAASVGLAALLRASEPAFLALRIVGAAYLLYLGARALWAAVRGDDGDHAERLGHRTIESRVAMRQGLLSNLANPKIAVFFTSFLPQFVPNGDTAFLSLLTLGLVFCAMTLVWLCVYSALVARAGDVLRRSRIRRALEGLTGTVLVAFGLRLATEHR